MERTNKVYAVGKLINLETRNDVSNGKRYIAGNFELEVAEENVLQFKFFSFEKTLDNKLNAKYSSYQKLDSLVDSWVKVTGEIAGRVFYNAAQGQIMNFNELSATFINPAKEEEVPIATFEYSGFVYRGLVERKDKTEKVVSYDLEVAQADYRGEKMSIMRFNIDPEARNIISSVQENYTKNKTISFNGIIEHTPKTETKVEEVDFGDPIIKTFRSVQKRYLITGGKAPILTDLAYSNAQISKLEATYATYLVEVERDAKQKSESGEMATKSEPAKSANINALI